MKPSTIIIICLVVMVLIFTVVFLWQSGFFDIHCDPEDQIQLKGILQGFTSNSSHRAFTNVRIDGSNYTFATFDKQMAMQFIGCNVEINTCYQTNTSHGNFYEMISIFLIGE